MYLLLLLKSESSNGWQLCSAEISKVKVKSMILALHCAVCTGNHWFVCTWNQWYIWHLSINYRSQVPRWVLAQQEMPYPAYYRSDLKLNLMIILMSLISRQWPCDFFVRNDTARGGPSSQKRKHLRKKLFLEFFKNEFSKIKFMKMTTSSAATTWPYCSDSSCLSSSSSPSPSSCRPSSRWPRWKRWNFFDNFVRLPQP